MALISPSGQFTLPKGDKRWSFTAVAAVLELVDPLGSGPWLSLTAAAFFFFFFFFFFFSGYHHLSRISLNSPLRQIFALAESRTRSFQCQNPASPSGSSRKDST
eukprot:FR736456.1.p2 GENE.FR736456.1~~FR736456.1.p2  ORF type:complete len:104 (-),score=30.71 FR736456.1:598-909(-)